MAAGHSPLQQFEVRPIEGLPPLHLAGYDVSFTNASLFMVLTIMTISLFMMVALRKAGPVPGRLQSLAELSYEFIATTIRDNAGKEGMAYMPVIFTLFMFVLFANLFGMIPYSFTVTSHIAVTFAMAGFVFVGVTIIALIKHGLHFFSFFLPKGTPAIMVPLMFLIELFSYLARPVSLSVRLAANMMAGHTMLKVIAGFVVMLGFLGGWAPLALLVALTGFEIFIAILQAYIFTVLTCIYLNDAIHLH
ncbi:MAG: F0F1 ATP synthase subunit A [Alphaproteobacteria bacterium]|nr:F0F1 ATP synthase subunit A [Alphaproteobacteria bacterium]